MSDFWNPPPEPPDPPLWPAHPEPPAPDLGMRLVYGVGAVAFLGVAVFTAADGRWLSALGYLTIAAIYALQSSLRRVAYVYGYRMGRLDTLAAANRADGRSEDLREFITNELAWHAREINGP